MADRTPFESIFAPEQKGVFGVMGDAFGVQSADERAGTARAQVGQTISQFMQQGSTAQEAVTKFLSTPGGAEAFRADPNLADTIAKHIQNVTPPAPQVINTPAGSTSTVIDRGGKTLTSVSAAPTEAQNWQAMRSASGLAPEDPRAQEAALQHLPPHEVRQQQKALEIARSLSEIDPANKINYFKNAAGLFNSEKVKGANGEEHILVFDKIGNPISQINLKSPVPPNPEGEAQRTDPNDPDRLDFARATMGLGVGVGGMLSRGAGAALGSVRDAWKSQSMQDNSNRAYRIQLAKTTLLGMADHSTDLGSGHLKAAVESWANLLPDANSVTTTPGDALFNMKSLVMNIDKEMWRDRNTVGLGNSDQGVIKAANARLDGWARVKSTLPTITELDAQIKALQGGESDSVASLPNVGRDVAGRAGAVYNQVMSKPGQQPPAQAQPAPQPAPQGVPSPAAPAPRGAMPAQPHQPALPEAGDSGTPLQLNTAPQQQGAVAPPEQQKTLMAIPTMSEAQVIQLAAQLQAQGGAQDSPLKSALRQRILELKAGKGKK